MTTSPQKQLAGDFIKNLLQNLPKEENINTMYKKNNVKNKVNDSPNINFVQNIVTLKLKDIKNFIKGVNYKEILPNDTINNCLLYPSALNINLLIKKIFSIFEVKSINELYLNLIEAFNAIYPKEKYQNANDINLKKIQLFELIQELNFFISPSVIYVSDPLINKLSFDIFISHILNENKIQKNVLESFINIFNIRHLVLDYFIWNKDKIIKTINNIPKLLSLISILNLENNFSRIQRSRQRHPSRNTRVFRLSVP